MVVVQKSTATCPSGHTMQSISTMGIPLSYRKMMLESETQSLTIVCDKCKRTIRKNGDQQNHVAFDHCDTCNYDQCVECRPAGSATRDMFADHCMR